MREHKLTKTKTKIKRATEVRHIRMDIDTSERIEEIAAYNGIAYGRIINLVMRAYVEANGSGLTVQMLTKPPQPGDNE